MKLVKSSRCSIIDIFAIIHIIVEPLFNIFHEAREMYVGLNRGKVQIIEANYENMRSEGTKK